MDKSWINSHRTSNTFRDGVKDFIDFARVRAIRGSIICPCIKCCNDKWWTVDTVHAHLLRYGFLPGYTTWTFHGERCTPSPQSQVNSVEGNFFVQDDMRGLVRDALGLNSLPLNNEQLAESTFDEDINASTPEGDPIEDIPYKKLVEECDKELYPGCKYSNLSFTLHLYHIKCIGGISNKSFGMLLELLRDAFPHLKSLPSSVYEAKKLTNDLGLGYEKIHACPNDCMLYWGEREGQQACHKEECLTFCSRYFEGVETPFNRVPRNDENIVEKGMYMLNSGGRKLGKVEIVELDNKLLSQAHRYVLLNHTKIQPFRNRFLGEKQSQMKETMDLKTMEKLLVEEFSWWLQQLVPFLESNKCDKEVLSLAAGPSTVAKQYKGFITNGFRFLTKWREEFKKTQNSGVAVEVEGGNYYGKLTNIIELEYFGGFKVVLFRCDWVDIRPSRGLKKDKYGFPLVNFSRPLVHTGEALKDDPFIICSQARQVFYIDDLKDVGWSHVIMTKPRDTYDMGSNVNRDDDDLYTECLPYILPTIDDINEAPRWQRTDIEMED